MNLRQNFFFKEANILRRVVRAVANEIRTKTNSTPWRKFTFCSIHFLFTPDDIERHHFWLILRLLSFPLVWSTFSTQIINDGILPKQGNSIEIEINSQPVKNVAPECQPALVRNKQISEPGSWPDEKITHFDEAEWQLTDWSETDKESFFCGGGLVSIFASSSAC